MVAMTQTEAPITHPVAPWIDEPRIDLRDKVTGEAKYVEDLPHLPRMAYAAALRSPYSHAQIVSVDSSNVEHLPGVLAVLDRERLKELKVNLERVLPLIEKDLRAT